LNEKLMAVRRLSCIESTANLLMRDLRGLKRRSGTNNNPVLQIRAKLQAAPQVDLRSVTCNPNPEIASLARHRERARRAAIGNGSFGPSLSGLTA
jgi:hypothetical protein